MTVRIFPARFMNLKTLLLTIFSIHAVAGAATAFQADQTQQQKNVESFELIWETIKNNHCDEYASATIPMTPVEGWETFLLKRLVEEAGVRVPEVWKEFN